MSKALKTIAQNQKPKDERAHAHAQDKDKAPIYKLTILNGTQKGAQYELDAKRYRLGSDELCDIVLIGEDIAKHHLDLFFANGVITITNISAPLFVDGGWVRDMPIEITPKQIIIIGKTALCFLSVADIEKGALPDFDTINEVMLNASQTPQKTKALWVKRLWQGLWDFNLSQIAPSQIILVGVFVIGSALSLLTILTLVGDFYIQEPKPIAHVFSDRLLKQISTDPAFKHIHVINSHPKKQLIGYVPRNADFNRLQHLAFGSIIDLNIVSLEKLNHSLHLLTHIYGKQLFYHLNPGNGRDMHLLLYGVINHIGQSEKIRARLKRDLPALTSIELNLITKEDALLRLDSWLAQYPNLIGLNGAITDDGLTIQGNLLGNFRDDWKHALIKNPPRLPQNMKPIINIHFSPSFEGQIASLVTGERAGIKIRYPHKTLHTRIGHKIKGGFKIKKIERNQITLEWQGKDFLYPLPE